MSRQRGWLRGRISTVGPWGVLPRRMCVVALMCCPLRCSSASFSCRRSNAPIGIAAHRAMRDSYAPWITFACPTAAASAATGSWREDAVQESGAAPQVCSTLEGKISDETFEQWNWEAGPKSSQSVRAGQRPPRRGSRVKSHAHQHLARSASVNPLGDPHVQGAPDRAPPGSSVRRKSRYGDMPARRSSRCPRLGPGYGRPPAGCVDPRTRTPRSTQWPSFVASRSECVAARYNRSIHRWRMYAAVWASSRSGRRRYSVSHDSPSASRLRTQISVPSSEASSEGKVRLSPTP